MWEPPGYVPAAAPRDRPLALLYQTAVMIRATSLYSFWFTSYPTPLATVGVRSI